MRSLPQPPAEAGAPLAKVDTPALVVDLDAFERNLARMAGALEDSPVRLRAHAKTHKSPEIARRQMAHGAIGVCCQKVSEAEIMVRGGVADVLVSNEVIGETKLARLAALAREARWLGLCVDSGTGVAQAEDAAAQAGVTLNALVEIDVGARRCGVAPGETAVELAERIADSPHLAFAGLQAYQGAAQHIRDHAERKAAIDRAVDAAAMTVELLGARGIACPIVGGGGTGSFEMEAASGVYTEIQAGSYIFMDADYARNRNVEGGPFDRFEHALFVLATVMSRPDADTAVVDAGHKAASVDSGPPEPYGMTGMVYERPSDEHGVLRLEGSNRPPALGETVLLVPGHCDPTVNLHDFYVGVRGLGGDAPHVESVWPVAARGAHL